MRDDTAVRNSIPLGWLTLRGGNCRCPDSLFLLAKRGRQVPGARVSGGFKRGTTYSPSQHSSRRDRRPDISCMFKTKNMTYPEKGKRQGIREIYSAPFQLPGPPCTQSLHSALLARVQQGASITSHTHPIAQTAQTGTYQTVNMAARVSLAKVVLRQAAWGLAPRVGASSAVARPASMCVTSSSGLLQQARQQHSAASTSFSKERSKSVYEYGAHRSDAEARIAEVPVVMVDGPVALCDGGE